MPGFDGAGPEGQGPRTGKGRGVRDNKKSDRDQPNQNSDSWLNIILRVLRLLKK